jgi:tripartite-type tricarboxylate transporter receptor subunit TctC
VWDGGPRFGSTSHGGGLCAARKDRNSDHTIPGKRSGNDELLAQRIDLFIDPPATLLENIKGGKLRAIAVTGQTRVAELPDVPTIGEAGFPRCSVTSWVGIVGPAKLPQDIVTRLNTEIRAHLTDPAVAHRIRALGSEPAPGSPNEFRDIVYSDLQRWSAIVADAKIERI